MQGILPSYKRPLAEMLADTFTREFFGSAVLKETVSSPALFEKLKPEIESHVDLFLREKLKVHFPMLSMLVGEKTISQLKNAFMTELEGLFPTVMNSYLGNLNSSDTKKIITKAYRHLAEKHPGFHEQNTPKTVYPPTAGRYPGGFDPWLFAGIGTHAFELNPPQNFLTHLLNATHPDKGLDFECFEGYLQPKK